LTEQDRALRDTAESGVKASAASETAGAPAGAAIPGLLHRRRVEKVKGTYGSEGKPPLSKFYSPLKITNSEFHAWLRHDWGHCGRKKRECIDAAADKLPSPTKL
jgi:hypothetical protein